MAARVQASRVPHFGSLAVRRRRAGRPARRVDDRLPRAALRGGADAGGRGRRVAESARSPADRCRRVAVDRTRRRTADPRRRPARPRGSTRRACPSSPATAPGRASRRPRSMSAAAGAEDPGEPWLIGLGGDRFVLIASSDAAERTALVPIDAREVDGAASIVLGPAVQVDAPIDDAGVADVDGDGALDLVVGERADAPPGRDVSGVDGLGLRRRGSRAPVPRSRSRTSVSPAGCSARSMTCPGRTWRSTRTPTVPPDRTSGPTCDCSRSTSWTGSLRSDRLAASAGIPPSMAPPVRFDADGDGRDELLGLVPRGLAVIDPLDGWADIRVASSAAMPLGTTAVTDPAAEPRTRVAWLEPAIEGRGSIGTELVRREATGSLDTGPATVRWDAPTPSDRWRALLADATIATLRQAGPVAWSGVLDDPSCRDLLVPTAMVACGSDSVAPSAAWVGTQPLFAFDSRAGRRLLVAAGIEREFGSGLPASPRPWAGGAAGRWRHGPRPGVRARRGGRRRPGRRRRADAGGGPDGGTRSCGSHRHARRRAPRRDGLPARPRRRGADARNAHGRGSRTGPCIERHVDRSSGSRSHRVSPRRHRARWWNCRSTD